MLRCVSQSMNKQPPRYVDDWIPKWQEDKMYLWYILTQYVNEHIMQSFARKKQMPKTLNEVIFQLICCCSHQPFSNYMHCSSTIGIIYYLPAGCWNSRMYFQQGAGTIGYLPAGCWNSRTSFQQGAGTIDYLPAGCWNHRTPFRQGAGTIDYLPAGCWNHRTPSGRVLEPYTIFRQGAGTIGTPSGRVLEP